MWLCFVFFISLYIYLHLFCWKDITVQCSTITVDICIILIILCDFSDNLFHLFNDCIFYGTLQLALLASCQL